MKYSYALAIIPFGLAWMRFRRDREPLVVATASWVVDRLTSLSAAIMATSRLIADAPDEWLRLYRIESARLAPRRGSVGVFE